MRLLRRAFWALGALPAFAAVLALSGLSVPVASAHSFDSTIVGHVYVNDNTAGSNTVAGFARRDDGALTPLPGSPFDIGGAGRGAITPSQGAIQRSSDGHYLLAVDAGSNEISVLRVLPDGTLQPVAGSPVASGGVEPVSIAVYGELVYVANLGSATDTPNYTGFTFDGGRLTPLANSTVALPIGSQPGDVLFNSNGTRLIGTRVATSLIDSFAVGPDGRLHAAPDSPYTALAAGPFGSAFRPDAPNQLFVSNAHAGAGAGAISAYHDGRDGALTPIGAGLYPDSLTAPCWVDITPNGQYLFTVNTGSGAIASYAIGSDGALTLVGSVAFKGGTSLASFDIRVSPDGRNAYVVDAAGKAVSAFQVSGGTLVELASSPIALPAGATPFGIVVD